MTNLDGTTLNNAIVYRVVDSYLGNPVKDWSATYHTSYTRSRARADSAELRTVSERIPNTQPRLPLDRYTGTYSDSLYGKVEVTSENGGLVLNMGPFYVGDMAHWHYDTFRVSWRDAALGRQFVTFTLDGAGKVSEIRVAGVGVFRR
jgi:hypothetical protein